MTSPPHLSKVDAEATVVCSEQPVRLFSFLSDLYLCESCGVPRPQPLILAPAYIFWSVFTSLAPTFFYFSVWKLAIAGPEASLLCTLSPMLLGIPSVRLFLTSRRGRIASHLLSLVGLVAYRFSDPLHRMWLVDIANIFACALAAVEWSGADSFYRGIGQSVPVTCPNAKLIRRVKCWVSVSYYPPSQNSPIILIIPVYPPHCPFCLLLTRSISMAICERGYWRVQQDWHLTRPSGRHGVISSSRTERPSTDTEGLGFQVVDNLRAGTWLPHLYFA